MDGLLKILAADDNPQNRLILELFGKKTRLTKIDLVDNGQEAIKRFEIGKYDLIVLDNMMPNLSGTQTARQIRSRDSSIPIALWSVSYLGPNSDLHKLALDSGVNEFWNKPLKLKEFEDYVLVHYQRIYSQFSSIEQKVVNG